MQTWSKTGYIAAAILLLICGIMHVQGIFYGEDLQPQHPDLTALMKSTSVKMDPTGMVWDLWVGFHAMYGICLVFMGAVLLILSIRHHSLLRTQHFMPLLFLSTVGFFLWIGTRYLITPFVISMAVILALLLAGYLIGFSQKKYH